MCLNEHSSALYLMIIALRKYPCKYKQYVLISCKLFFQILLSTMKQVFTVLALILLINPYVQSIKVHCQSQPSNRSNHRFKVNQRDILVSTIYDGVDVFVDDMDGYVSRIIKEAGNWQPRNLRNIARFVQPGYTVINAGTHIRLQSIVLGKGLGPKGKLFMFEPFSVSHNLALKNIYFNGLADITTSYNIGVGSSYSKQVESINMQNTGGSIIVKNTTNTGDPLKTVQVIVDTIDSVLPQDAIIDFVLMDVERMELEALTGMRNTIMRSPNIVIFCEWAGNYFKRKGEGQKMIDVVNWMKQHNFKFYQMARGEAPCTYATWMERTAQQIMDAGHYPDILFVPSHIDPNKVGV